MVLHSYASASRTVTRAALHAGKKLAAALNTIETISQIANPNGSKVKSNPLRNITRTNVSPKNLLTGHANNVAIAHNFKRAEFLAHYHKRSNVETTFSMIKSKFGERLRSKTETAQGNEALCKVLCHNLCVVIQSMYELNITPEFMNEAA